MEWYILASLISLILGVVFVCIYCIYAEDKNNGNSFLVLLGAILIVGFLFLQLLAVDTHRKTITAEEYLLNPQNYQVDKLYRDSIIIEYKVSIK